MAFINTPADLQIQPRNLRFGREERRERWWLANDPVATAWFNSLSVCFPQGEAFFVESVRHFQGEVPEALTRDIAAFVKQEVNHSREHVAFNRQVVDGGYSTKAIDERLTEMFGRTRDYHPVAKLAMTVALEHFTAIFAHAFLENRAMLAGAPAEVQRLWLWHALEEVEHKAVAFDTYMHVTRDLSPFRRWLIRTKTFLSVSRDFVRFRTADAVNFLAQDGITGWRARSRLAWYLVVSPGLFRKVLPQWLSFLLPGFHPWDIDDRVLMQSAQDSFGLEAAVAATA